MKHARTAIAVSALALSAAVLGATQASAQYEPDPGSAPATVLPVPAPGPDTDLVKASVDNTVSEGIQAGASALGGAAVALGAVWFYRRRQAVNG